MVDGRISRGVMDVSTRVVEAVAASRGVAPTDLPVQLYDVVDPDALECLLQSDCIEVTFEYDGHAVQVDASGAVHVEAAR
jgi:hypothetical protein